MGGRKTLTGGRVRGGDSAMAFVRNVACAEVIVLPPEVSAQESLHLDVVDLDFDCVYQQSASSANTIVGKEFVHALRQPGPGSDSARLE